MTKTKTVVKEVLWNPVTGCHFPNHSSNQSSHFIQLKYIPQVGPQCGFAALCMIASYAGIDVSPDDLVSKAKEENISNYGEMFSACNMANFAQNLFSSHFEVTLFTNSIKGLSYQFRDYFDNDNLILIPYDCDFNHEPCLKNGAAAHWAVLCGYVNGNDEENFHVIACHGKSRYAAIWKYTALQESNDNLRELGTKRLNDGKNYILPAGGVKEGIASQWILFKRK
ncbi:actin maturation protease [Planococcus citri]|uniref:actin maturation protease n=1 Tax=Planococcus citri TaxID=170843 RepID=UPI0031FA0912